MEAKEETYLQSCKNIMRTLLSKKYKNLNWIFKDPLEPTALGLDDYKKIVKYPLDLGTISRRLRVKYYLNPFHFVTDVRRVFENTYLYTTPGHLCYVMAQKLESIFEDLVAKYIPFCSHGSGVKIDKVQYFDFNRCDARDEEAESNIDSGDDDIIGDEYENEDEDNEYEDESESEGQDDRNEQENISNDGDTNQYIIVNQNENMNNGFEDKRQHWKHYGYLSSSVDNGNEISQYGNKFDTDNEYQNMNYEYESNDYDNRMEDYGNEMDNNESVKGEGVVAFKNYIQYWEKNEYQNNNEFQYNAYNNVDMDNRYGNNFETQINERIEDKGADEDMNCANENSRQNWANNNYQYNNNQYVSNAVYNGDAYSQYGNNNGYQNIHYTYGIWMAYGQYWEKPEYQNNNGYFNNFYENVTADNRYGNNFEGADEHLNNGYENNEDENMNYEYENNAGDNRVNAFETDNKEWVKEKGAVAYENNSQYWEKHEYQNNEYQNNEYQYNAYNNVDMDNRYGNNYETENNERTEYEGAEENNTYDDSDFWDKNEYGNNAYDNVDSVNRNGNKFKTDNNERIEYEGANQSPHTYEDSQYEYVASDANDDDKDLEEPMTHEFDSYLQVSLQQLEGVMLHKVFHMIYQSEDLHFQHPIKKIKFDVRRLKVKTKRAIIEYIESQGMSGKRACRLKDL